MLCSLATLAFDPTWDSLNKRPFPSWYNEAKIGFKVHWGPYSVPGYGDKTLHGEEAALAQSCLYEYYYNVKGTPTYDFHRRVYGDAPYGDFGHRFTAELFDPDEWGDLFKRAGARYSYMTMKHGDGFCLFDSATQPYWNSVVMGARRDLIGDYVQGLRRSGLKAGVFVELSEASNPECPAVVVNVTTGSRIWGNCTKSEPTCAGRENNCTLAYRQYLHTQITESVTRYSPDLLYLDDNVRPAIPRAQPAEQEIDSSHRCRPSRTTCRTTRPRRGSARRSCWRGSSRTRPSPTESSPAARRTSWSTTGGATTRGASTSTTTFARTHARLISGRTAARLASTRAT
jgi:hypothetical protein